MKKNGTKVRITMQSECIYLSIYLVFTIFVLSFGCFFFVLFCFEFFCFVSFLFCFCFFKQFWFFVSYKYTIHTKLFETRFFFRPNKSLIFFRMNFCFLQMSNSYEQIIILNLPAIRHRSFKCK